jgi:type II secretory pathway pseudopilin PulG
MRARSAVTLVEVLVSVAVLGLALAPIVGIAHKSFSQIRAEKDEANAAAVAGQLCNQILFEIPYEKIIAKSYQNTSVSPPETILPEGEKTVDGTLVHWEVDIQPVDPLRFAFRRLKYHGTHPNAVDANVTQAQFNDSTLFYQDGAAGPTLWNKAVTDIDKKYSGDPVMHDCKIDIKWKAPGATAWSRTETLFVRRAKLD